MMLKKALSLVLALLMAFNMGISALALELGTVESVVPTVDAIDETVETEAAEQEEFELEPVIEEEVIEPTAAEPQAETDVVKVEHNGETTYYADLQKAFDGFAPSNNTYSGTYNVTLLGDTTGVNKDLKYPSDGTIHIVLDLNGHTVTATKTTSVAVKLTLKEGTATTPNTFTVKDSSGNNSGKITGGSTGLRLDGKYCTLYFQGGTITDNHGSNGAGIFMGATSKLEMTGGVITGNTVKGNGSAANTGFGAGVYASNATISGGVITGNIAYKGTNVQSGRGGGVCTPITRTKGFSTLEIANGTVYGNTAENAGDDVMAQGNGMSTTKFTFSVGTENWYIDGWNGKKGTSGGGQVARYDAENPVPYTDGGFTDQYNKHLGLKYVAPEAEEEVPEAPNVENADVAAYMFVCNTKLPQGVFHQHTSIVFDTGYSKAGEVVKNEAGEWTVEVTHKVRKMWEDYIGILYGNWYPDYVHEPKEELPETLTVTMKWDSENGKWLLDGELTHYDISCPRVAPEAPDKYGENVTPALIRVICDTEEDHAPMDIKWQFQSTEIYPKDSKPEWDEELGAWTIGVKIDSISVYYVWMNFEKANNNIVHDLVVGKPLPEDTYHIVTDLKWDEDKELWVTLDEEPIEIHVSCKTVPDAPKHTFIKSLQIAVKGDLDGDGVYGENGLTNESKIYELFTTSIPEDSYEMSEVYGSREEGFFVDCTVTLEDGDIFISNWIEKRAPGKDFVYDWNLTEKTVKYTLKYTGDLEGNLQGDQSGDWVLKDTGKSFGVVAEAFVAPGKPVAPVQDNITDELVTVICDSDPDRHAPVTGKWYPTHCDTTSEIAWNEEVKAWTVDVRIGGLYIMYVDQLEDANGGTEHTLVEDITTVFTTLKWDVLNGEWVPVEPIELHTTCRTAPLAPEYDLQLEGYQIKVFGDVKGAEKAWTTTIAEDGYTLSEVYGSREEGFFVDVNVTLANGDIYHTTWMEKRAEGVPYEYDWEKTPATVTFTLEYNGSLTGTLHGDRHASNTNYDWVLKDSGKTYGVVANTYLKVASYTLNLDANGGAVEPASISVTYNEAIGELPVPVRSNHIFLGWFDAEGNEVTAETIYTVAGDSTVTAKWSVYPSSGSGNVTKELFTIQCTEVHEHSWLCNWFGSHVSYVKDSVKWNEELGRWEAQAKIGSSMLNMINMSNPKKNYFGGVKHYYDETNYTFDLYFDPDFTGLNSEGKEVTGMWLPVKEYIVDVYCYTEPSMPDVSKITTTAVWVRDVANKLTTHSQKFTLKQFVDGTYSLGEMYSQDGKFYVDLTVTDVNAYVEKLEAKTGKEYVIGDWELHYTAGDFKFTLEYTGDVKDYKQDGTGWSISASSWANNSEKLNGKSLWVTEQFTVTYKDGAEGAYFADEVYTVNGFVENGETKNAVTDFTANNTPEFVGPAVRTGYTRTGWTPEWSATVTADAVYTAVWTANEYTVTFDAEGGEVEPASKVVVFDSAVGELPVPERYGYTFVGWTTEDGEPVNAETVYTVAGDSTYVALWEKNVYTVTFDAQGGSCEEATRKVVYLDEVGKLPAVVHSTKVFVGWYDAEDNKVNPNYVVTGDVTLYAKYAKGISIDMGGNGSGTGAGLGQTTTSDGVTIIEVSNGVVIISRGDEETNPNTGAPVVTESPISAVAAIAVLGAAAYVIGKRK